MAGRVQARPGALGKGLRRGRDRFRVRRYSNRLLGGAAGAGNARDLGQQILAGLELTLDIGGHLFAAIEPIVQSLLALAHGRLKPSNGALGDFGGGDQFGNGGAQRLLVGLEQAQLLIEPHAIKDREQQ